MSSPTHTAVPLQALAMPVVRRHARTTGKLRHGPTVEVVSGNYVTGKRRGVVDGVDFEGTGKVRFLQQEAINAQLQQNHIVLLNSLAYSASGGSLL